MSRERNMELVRDAYEALNDRDFEAAAQLYAEDVELTQVATSERYQGRDGYLQHARGWTAALPDLRLEILHLDAGEDSVVVEYLLRGTHSGTLIGAHGHIPPTWMQVEVHFCDSLRVRDGAIARVHSYFDAATLLRQLGLLPNSPIHPVDRRAPLELYALETDAPVQQRNKAVVQWFLQTVVNQHDAAAAAEFCVSNLAWHGGPIGELRDLASFQQLLSSLFASFPDLQVEVKDSVAEGDRVAVRLSMIGTHRGDFQGIPPTGKVVTGTWSSTYRIVDGKIVEEWWYLDLFGMMKQLDVMPSIVRLSPNG